MKSTTNTSESYSHQNNLKQEFDLHQPQADAPQPQPYHPAIPGSNPNQLASPLEVEVPVDIPFKHVDSAAASPSLESGTNNDLNNNTIYEITTVDDDLQIDLLNNSSGNYIDSDVEYSSEIEINNEIETDTGKLDTKANTIVSDGRNANETVKENNTSGNMTIDINIPYISTVFKSTTLSIARKNLTSSENAAGKSSSSTTTVSVHRSQSSTTTTPYTNLTITHHQVSLHSLSSSNLTISPSTSSSTTSSTTVTADDQYKQPALPSSLPSTTSMTTSTQTGSATTLQQKGSSTHPPHNIVPTHHSIIYENGVNNGSNNTSLLSNSSASSSQIEINQPETVDVPSISLNSSGMSKSSVQPVTASSINIVTKSNISVTANVYHVTPSSPSKLTSKYNEAAVSFAASTPAAANDKHLRPLAADSKAVYIAPVVLAVCLLLALACMLLYIKRRRLYRKIFRSSFDDTEKEENLTQDIYSKVDFIMKRNDKHNFASEETIPLTDFPEKTHIQDNCVTPLEFHSSLPLPSLPDRQSNIYNDAAEFHQLNSALDSTYSEIKPVSDNNNSISVNSNMSRPDILLPLRQENVNAFHSPDILPIDNDIYSEPPIQDNTSSSDDDDDNIPASLFVKKEENPYSLKMFLPHSAVQQAAAAVAATDASSGSSGVNPNGYLAPSCHSHTGPNWRPYHPYDPVYVPTTNASAMNRLVDSTGYVSRPRRPHSDPPIVYEEINYGQVNFAACDNSEKAATNSPPPPLRPRTKSPPPSLKPRGSSSGGDQTHRPPPLIPRTITMGATASGGNNSLLSHPAMGQNTIDPTYITNSITTPVCSTYNSAISSNSEQMPMGITSLPTGACEVATGTGVTIRNTGSLNEGQSLSINIPARVSQASSGTSREEVYETMYETVDFDSDV